MKRFRIVFAVGLAVAGVLVGPNCWLAGSPVTVGADVPAARLAPVERIDHSPWDALLNKYVDSAGTVDYSKWKSSVANP